MEKSCLKVSFSLQVSILVFVELVLDVSDLTKLGRITARFQSLFSWNLFLMPDRSPPGQVPQVVSILVFVELVLDAFGS